MKEWTTFLWALSLSIGFVYGQNLVPNGDFEDYISCPTSVGNSALANWNSPNEGTPDYFHICGIANTTGVPLNYAGNQAPLSDSAYCGMVVKNSGNSTLEWREYLQIQLLSPLEPGSLYEFSMEVSLSEISQLGSDAIAVLFSTNPVSREDNLRLTQTPQLNNPPGNFITNKEEWVLISESYIADSAYQYITIGNFLNDFNTATVPVEGGLFDRSYFYIDNVTLSFITAVNSTDVPSSLKLYPNPFRGRLHIEHDLSESAVFVLYDLSAREILRETLSPFSSFLNTNPLAKGIYIYKIQTPEGEMIHSGRIVKE